LASHPTSATSCGLRKRPPSRPCLVRPPRLSLRHCPFAKLLSTHAALLQMICFMRPAGGWNCEKDPSGRTVYWHDTRPRLVQHEHPHDPYFRGLVRLHRQEGALRARIERAAVAQTARRATSFRDGAASGLAAGRDSPIPLAMRTGARKGADLDGESSELLASSDSEASLGGSHRDGKTEQSAGRMHPPPCKVCPWAGFNVLTRSSQSLPAPLAVRSIWRSRVPVRRRWVCAGLPHHVRGSRGSMRRARACHPCGCLHQVDWLQLLYLLRPPPSPRCCPHSNTGTTMTWFSGSPRPLRRSSRTDHRAPG